MWLSLFIVGLAFIGAPGDPFPLDDTPRVVVEGCKQLRARRRLALEASQSPTASPRDRDLAAALTQYLILAETLVRRGGQLNHPEDARLVIFGLTMLDGQAAIEAALSSRSSNVDTEMQQRARDDVALFTRRVRSGLPQLPENSEETLWRVRDWLVPLRRAAETLVGNPAPAGWWIDERLVPDVAEAPDSRLTLGPEKVLEGALAESLRQHAAGGRTALSQACVALMTELISVPWMSGAARRAVEASLLGGLEHVASGALDEDQAQRRVAGLHATIRALQQFAESPGARGVATRRSGVLVELIDAAGGGLPRPAPSRAIADGLSLLAQCRQQESEATRGGHDRLHAQLARQRHATEQRLFEAFPEIAQSPAPWTEPGLVVMLAEPRDLLRAMHRTQRVHAWSEEARTLNPDEAPSFTRRMSMLVERTVHSDTREDASAALDEYERQRDLYQQLSRDLEAASGPWPALQPSAARAGSRWIRDWARGQSAGRGARDLYRLVRLRDHGRCLEALDNQRLADLDGWSAWELPQSALRRWREAYREELTAQIAAFRSGNRDAVDEKLAELDRTFAPLRLLAAVAMQAPTRESIHRGLAALGELTDQPTAWSLLGGEETQLALLGLALMELASREGTDGDFDPTMLRDWCNEQAAVLRQQVDRMPVAPLVIPGLNEAIPAENPRDRPGMMR